MWIFRRCMLLPSSLIFARAFQRGGGSGWGSIFGPTSHGGASFCAPRTSSGRGRRRLCTFRRRDGDEGERDGHDDDNDDDDDPPSLSTSPQEFLFRMQQNQNDGDDATATPARGPRRTGPAPRSRPAFGAARRKKSSPGKDGVVYVCTSCGSEYAQWRGRCGACSEWNTIQAVRRRIGKKPSSLGEEGRAASRRSWLDGVDGTVGENSGGPVRVTDVYQEMVHTSGMEDGSLWEEAFLNGSLSEQRITVPDDPEMNAVLGGGLMPGSISLVGGDPGVGKSTLLLQMAGSVASTAERSLDYPGIGMGPPRPSPTTYNKSEDRKQQQTRQKSGGGGPILYVSGEENAGQIASRALRLGIRDPELLLWCETDADTIADAVASFAYGDGSPPLFDNRADGGAPPLSRLPSLLIVDSIQTMVCDAAGASATGGVTQVRECVGLFLRLAKSTGVPVILVGHVTKTGDVAGPRTVEHMVDCVLYLEGSAGEGQSSGAASEGGGANGSASSLRVLRAAKNRFGSSEEVGVYEAGRDGRLMPVSDPSSLFLSTRKDSADVEGCATSAAMEGARSMMVEVQALVAWAAGPGGGRRIVDGISYSRLLLILAVLQKRCGMSFHRRDVYVNVAGGMRLGAGGSRGGGESDLAVAVALASSLIGTRVRSDTAFVGEVGLLGELRPVRSLERRLGEARRMGFSRIVTPSLSPRGRRGEGKAGPREVSAGGIKQVLCDNVLDAINCGLVAGMPTKQTANGPKWNRPKQSLYNVGVARRGSQSFGMGDLDIILDDDDDDVFE